MKNKIGIIGIGAIGSVIADALRSNKSNSIYYYNRTSKTEIKIEFDGNRSVFPIKFETESTQNQKLDWIIICLKAYHFHSATSLFKSLIGENTKIAILRNGISLSEDLEPYTSKTSILPCMIDCPVQPIEDGYYRQFKHPIITTTKSNLAEEFNNLFLSDNITINQVVDFKTENWKKLIESSALGSIQCLTGQTCHIFEDVKILKLYKKLIKEGISVAQVDGAKIETDFENRLILKLRNYPKDKGSSMLTDRLKGNKIELEAKNGAITKIAKFYDIDTPLNDLFCTLIEKIN